MEPVKHLVRLRLDGSLQIIDACGGNHRARSRSRRATTIERWLASRGRRRVRR